MEDLVRVAKKEMEDFMGGPMDPHLAVCTRLANMYDLWDENDRFPTWLSRIVAGVKQDIEENYD
jgi:hypothetical protein